MGSGGRFARLCGLFSQHPVRVDIRKQTRTNPDSSGGKAEQLAEQSDFSLVIVTRQVLFSPPKRYSLSPGSDAGAFFSIAVNIGKRCSVHRLGWNGIIETRPHGRPIMDFDLSAVRTRTVRARA